MNAVPRLISAEEVAGAAVAVPAMEGAWPRRVLTAGLAVVGLDLLMVVVSGGWSPLAPGGTRGFLVRLLLLAALFVLRTRASGARRFSAAHVALGLLLLPTLAELHLAGGRLGGDGVMYYVYVRSLVKDGDLDFSNEYAQYGLLDRGDLAMATDTGLRRSIFAVGPGLLWTPFFLVGEGIGRLQLLLTGQAVLSGYGPPHLNAVALGSLLYGLAALFLVHDLLRRRYPPAAALGAVLVIWGATFLYWYMVHQPTMSHAASTFAAAFALWLWERHREQGHPRGFLLLGLALGVAMCVRWQNGIFLSLPALDLLHRARHRGIGATWAPAVGLAAGVLIGALPQMWAWKVIYGRWLLLYPPHGADFVRLDHPWVLETLFSSRHGLLFWTPVLWAGYLGFLPFLRRHPRLAAPLLVPLLLMTYVNMCSGDWWAGGSFSNRRFDSLLPVLAFGLAAALEWGRLALQRRPTVALGCLVLPLAAWNVLLAEVAGRGQVPRGDTVAFPRLVRAAAARLSDTVGSPPAWPANWLFAWRHRDTPARYDLVAGRYLFYRQNNLGGRVDIGAPGDDVVLADGWSGVERGQGRNWRRVRGRARFYVGLDLPEDLELAIRAAADRPGEVRLIVNDREAGRLWAGPAWEEHRLRVGASAWRREVNVVAFQTDGEAARVDAVLFARRP